jgi:hypothetical protein
MKPTSNGGVVDTPVIEITQRQMAQLLDKVCSEWRGKLLNWYGTEVITHGYATIALSRAKKLIEEGKPEKGVLDWIYKQWPVLEVEEIRWDDLRVGSVVKIKYDGSKAVLCTNPEEEDNYIILSIDGCLNMWRDQGELKINPNSNTTVTVLLHTKTGEPISYLERGILRKVVTKVVKY